MWGDAATACSCGVRGAACPLASARGLHGCRNPRREPGDRVQRGCQAYRKIVLPPLAGCSASITRLV